MSINKNKLRRLCIYPWVENSTNPYQRLNKDSLEANGYNVFGLEYWPFFPITSAIIRSNKSDIIMLDWVHSFFTSSSLFATLVKLPLAVLDLYISYLFKKPKIVWNLHNLHRHDKKHYQIERFCFQLLAKRVDIIRLFSQSAMGQAKRHLKIISDSKFVISYHGNYSQVIYKEKLYNLREKYDINEDGMLLLIFGSIRRNKGVLEFLKDFKNIESSFNLLMVGKPEDNELKMDILAEVTGSERIHLDLDFVLDKDIYTIFSQCDVVVFPYTRITNSGAVFLALGLSKSILATDLPFFREILKSANHYLYKNHKELQNILVEIESVSDQKKLLAPLYDWKQLNNVFMAEIQRKLVDE